MRSWRWLAVMTLVGLGFGGSITAAPSSADDEVTEGKALYEANCAVCHGSTMAGGQFGPSLKGAAFISKWRGNKDDLHQFITAKMPPADPGSLTSDQYNKITTAIREESALDTFGEDAQRSDALHGPSSGAVEGTQIGPMPAPAQLFRDETYRRTIEARTRLLDGLTPVTNATLRAPRDEDWLAWRGGYANLGFSKLTAINRKTVGKLTVQWAWSLPVSANQIAPIVHDGVMFVNSANQVQALDAATGTLLWRYTRNLPQKYRGITSSRNRNFAIYGTNLYLSTPDRHVIALDVKTGKLVWETEIVTENGPSADLSSGPVIVNGKVIQASANGATCQGVCSVVALDYATGRQLWQFRTVPRAGEPGGDTWNGAPDEERFGGAIWVAGSYDPGANLVYFGVSGTYRVSALLSPPDGRPLGNNDGLYTGSTIALDPETGKLAWHHQHFAGEVWDLDEAFERALISLPVDGRMRDAVVTTGKVGILDALDRKTGEYLFSYDLGLQDLVSAINPKTGRRTIDPRFEPKPKAITSICPSPEGVRNWMAGSYDPRSAIMYLPMEETCMRYWWLPDALAPGQNVDIGWTVTPPPGSDGRYGRLEAFDLKSRRSLWVQRTRAPLSSSLLATAGGILFSGSRDRMFQAVDDRTGRTLWQVRLNGVPNATPITYSVGGRQFVAITAGGGGPHDSESIEVTPEIDNSTAATTVWVFAVN